MEGPLLQAVPENAESFMVPNVLNDAISGLADEGCTYTGYSWTCYTQTSYSGVYALVVVIGIGGYGV
ncbi:MAG: hypothetical protein ACFFCO_06730 [Promethearchaeota archaeon]